ncbi:MAG: alpha/beta hydrolase [Actinobacteria bacterium]|nr:alpha/beta hydrolase [Actinomycetota bacterium]
MNISSVDVIPVDGGTVAYEIAGAGPLVVFVPGMGDLRSTWRHLAPSLIAADYRVALTDLRGHGDSSTDFAEYDDEATARDIIALVEHLGEPAVVIGNSMGAGSAVIAAAARPELVRGLVLVGPFVRNPPSVGAAMRLAFRVLMARPWAAAVWKGYLPSLYKGRLPEDQTEYLATVAAALKRPGYGAAFSRTTRTTHAPAEAALPAVSAPALVIMGELDPDFPTPAAEAAWIGDQLSATVVMVAEAGHYPQSQRPDVVVPAVASFLADLGTNA